MVTELCRYGAHIISLDFSTANATESKRVHAFVSAFLDSELPGHHLPASLVEKLTKHTGGNALFLSELLKYAREKGHIFWRNGRWRLVGEIENFEPPKSVETLIEARIAELSDELRETLILASVEGEEFTAEVLSASPRHR
jgi:predicted ATPase